MITKQTAQPPQVHNSPTIETGTSTRPPFTMLVAFVVLLLAFASPLLRLIQFAWNSSVYSHILIIPFLVVYLLYSLRHGWKFHLKPRPLPAALPLFLGAFLMIGGLVASNNAWNPPVEDHLAVHVLSAVLFFWSIVAAFLPLADLKRAAFSLGLLVFLAPFPTAVLSGIETFLQRQSAEVAHFLFFISGMPFVRDDLVFRLPGITLQVAPECSGVRSTLALFITSLVGGYLLLRSPWRRTVLSAAVIPLALLRNGFRIFVIGQLCVEISPDMIHSRIHRSGGPLFFALSLIPFLLLLIWLKVSERRRTGKAATGTKQLQSAE